MAGNPREQRSSTPDIAFLLERGGLTPAHWEQVIRTIGRPKDPIAAKIVAYGQNVITGDYPDTGNHHRAYLGQRHWVRIVRLNTLDRHVTHRWLWLSITKPVLNPTAREASVYADSEMDSTYTLDDHINSSCRDSITDYHAPHILDIRWALEHQKWEVESYRIESYPNPHNPPYEWNTGPETSISVRVPLLLTEEDLARAQSLLWETWLLTESEVIDPFHTSPTILTERLREAAVLKPDEIKERLKARRPLLLSPLFPYDSPHFGILEKEVA